MEKRNDPNTQSNSIKNENLFVQDYKKVYELSGNSIMPNDHSDSSAFFALMNNDVPSNLVDEWLRAPSPMRYRRDSFPNNDSELFAHSLDMILWGSSMHPMSPLKLRSVGAEDDQLSIKSQYHISEFSDSKKKKQQVSENQLSANDRSQSSMKEFLISLEGNQTLWSSSLLIDKGGFDKVDMPLSQPEDELKDKKIIQLEKRRAINKQSAKKFREKKKDYIQTLEQKIAVLEMENARLKEEIALMRYQESSTGVKTFDEMNQLKQEFIAKIGDRIKDNKDDLLTIMNTAKDRSNAINTNTLIEFNSMINKAIDKALPEFVKRFFLNCLGKQGLFSALDYCERKYIQNKSVKAWSPNETVKILESVKFSKEQLEKMLMYRSSIRNEAENIKLSIVTLLNTKNAIYRQNREIIRLFDEMKMVTTPEQRANLVRWNFLRGGFIQEPKITSIFHINIEDPIEIEEKAFTPYNEIYNTYFLADIKGNIYA